MTSASRKRRFVRLVLLGGIAIAAAALATAFSVDGAYFRALSLVGMPVILGVVAAALVAYAARRLRRAQPHRMILFWLGWRLAALVAMIALLAAWGIAALAGFGAAPALLQAFLLALVGGVFIGIAGTALSNLLGAIQGPAPDA